MLRHSQRRTSLTLTLLGVTGLCLLTAACDDDASVIAPGGGDEQTSQGALQTEGSGGSTAAARPATSTGTMGSTPT